MDNNQYYGTNNQDKRKKTSPWISVFAIVTICALLFSAVQTVFIFRLTTGAYGNMTYTRGMNNRDDIEDDSSGAVETDRLSAVADPEFSLEHAASVTDPDKETLSTTEIVRLVSPATVSVYVMGEVYGQSTPIYSGTGFIISEEGYVVTNMHVIEDVEDNDYEIIVAVPGFDRPIDAQIVGSDIQTDIAVLKLMSDDQSFPYVTLGDSDVLQVGELVVAIGNPLGTLEGTVTVGVVSALNREINNNGYTMKLIQTDASINSGNSGGPLINSFGEVIGVTNAKISSAEGLGFAIPITNVRDVIQSIINYGYVANRPWLGLTAGNIADGAYYGAIAGVYCAEVERGGPADRAGMRSGDLILSFDGVEIGESGDIIDVRDSHVPGDEVEVIVERDGHKLQLTLIIGDSNDAQT